MSVVSWDDRWEVCINIWTKLSGISFCWGHAVFFKSLEKPSRNVLPVWLPLQWNYKLESSFKASGVSAVWLKSLWDLPGAGEEKNHEGKRGDLILNNDIKIWLLPGYHLGFNPAVWHDAEAATSNQTAESDFFRSIRVHPAGVHNTWLLSSSLPVGLSWGHLRALVCVLMWLNSR